MIACLWEAHQLQTNSPAAAAAAAATAGVSAEVS